MTMKEASDARRIPVNTLRYYRHTGEGPKSALIGGRIMYLREAIEKWIDEAFDNDVAK